jgi:hypothetical protein
MEMANAAFRLASRNEHGKEMVIEHLKRAIQTLEAQTPNTELRRAGHLSNDKQTGATPRRLD